MQDGLLLTPNIARELIRNYEQFTKFKENEVGGLSFAQFQKLLLAYGALYFNTKELGDVLKELANLAHSTQQILPSAAVPNADRLKSLIEEHEKLVQEKTAHKADDWLKQQSAVVKKRLAEVEAASAVVYDAHEPVAAPVATQERPPPDEIRDWSKERRLENLETILAEANIPEPFRHSTAEQLDQILELSQAEGIPLDQERLKERIFTLVARTTGTTPTPEVVESVAERIPKPPVLGASPSAFEGGARPYHRQIPEARTATEQVVETETHKNIRAQQYLYLALRDRPYWEQLGSQFLSAFRPSARRVTVLENLQKIREAINTLRAQAPAGYARDLPIILALEQRVDDIIAANALDQAADLAELGVLTDQTKKLESVEIITPEIAADTLLKIDEATHEIYRLELNPQTQDLEIQSTTKQESLRSLSPAPGEERQEQAAAPQISTQRVAREFLKESKSARQNLFSNLAIRFKNFLSNTSRGIGRFFSFSLPRALGFGGRLGSGLVATTMPSSGGSLAIPASRMLGGMFNLGGTGLRGGATLASRALVGLAALGGAEALPLVAIVIGVFVGVFALAIFVNTIQHGVFLKETTSVAIIPESKYISLTKTAEPTSLANSALPAEVKYTIAVGAKEKNLKNVRLSEQFSAYGKNNPPTPSLGTHSISPNLSVTGTPENFSFILHLSPEYADSVVVNTVTVTADVEDGPSGESTTRTATVIVGSPPTGCFTFAEGGGVAWMPGDKALLASAIARVSQYPTYMATLCSQGSIRVLRGSVADGGESGHVIGKDIYLFNTAFSGIHQLSYTLSHESGHVFAKVDGAAAFFKFAQLKVTQTEDILPTYPRKYLNEDGSNKIDEDFAETIGLYIIRREFKTLGGEDIASMSARWPLHYQFARTNIFGNQE